MDPWKINVPVLLIFFVRADPFTQVFEAVRKAKPSVLLLWQDGPRKGCPEDVAGIAKCRAIVEQIDWDCTVYRQYHEENMGCDPSTFLAHKWAFSIVDKCIILEDDFVADQSFFPYCKELLDKYEYDERINHICGFNLLGNYEGCPYDYLFANTGSNAWASWKRVVDGWDDTYRYLHDPYFIKNLKEKYGKQFKVWHAKALEREASGKAYWESILCFDSILNSRYAIIPKRNMVINIGMTSNSAHSDTQEKYLTKTERKLFNMKVYPMEFPMNHPPYVIADGEYTRRLNRFYGNGHPFIRLGRKLYHAFMYLLYGTLGKQIKKKFGGKSI